MVTFPSFRRAAAAGLCLPLLLASSLLGSSGGDAYAHPGHAREPAWSGGLEARFREAAASLDTLLADTGRVPFPERRLYLASLHAATAVLDDIHFRLSELRNLERSGYRRDWETLRDRTERSLFGLGRFFAHARTLGATGPRPHPFAPADTL